MHGLALPIIALLAAVSVFSVAEAQPTSQPTTRPRAQRRPERPLPPPLPEPFPIQLRNEFVNAEHWPDVDGYHINAHGGGVIFHEGVYYWYGEERGKRTPDVRWPDAPGVSVYTSTDLYNWKKAATALSTVDDPESPITKGCNIERPKVVFNAKTGKFVMWFHLELKGRGYGAAYAGLAVSDTPTGPFKFLWAGRPNAGKWSIEFPEADRTPYTREQQAEAMKGPDFRKGLVAGAYARRDFEGGQMSRDMTLFVDPDDGKGYLISSAEENYTLNIHELNDDYLGFTGKWLRLMPGGHNEAPAIIKHEGKYHLLASGCTGWDPNPARSMVADNIWGPWKMNGNPLIGINPRNGMGPELTWGGQSTWILPLPNQPGKYVAMFDEWRPVRLTDSGYLWLPLRVENGKMMIEWKDRWMLGEPGQK